MAYIYIIKNDINDKVYIGKTRKSIQSRFSEHLYNARNNRNNGSSIYKAMRKYGAQHFHVEMIEETDFPEEREIYWIQFYDSYKHGYNNTRGGDGRPYIDRKQVLDTYLRTKSEAKTAKKLGISTSQTNVILKELNIEILDSCKVNLIYNGIKIKQYSKSGEYIATFPSSLNAAMSLNKITEKSEGAASHITDVCKGRRNSAYGYVWKFDEE